MKRTTSLFFFVLMVFFSCENELIRKQEIIPQEGDNLVFEARSQIDFTRSSELVLQLETDADRINFVFEDADLSNRLIQLDESELRITHSDRLLILADSESNARIGIGLRGDKTVISENIKNRDALIQELSKRSVLYKLDDYIETKNIIAKPGDLGLKEGFADEFESVFNILDPKVSRNSRSLSRSCVDGGCGVQQCGGQLITILGAVEVSPVQCASGFFCCTPNQGATPICFPCGECADETQGYDPCTGETTGGGGGGPSGGGLGETGSCIYVIEIVFYDGDGNVVARETYVVFGPC